MTFLPIVERELRVAARRRGTYWLRFWAGLGAMAFAAVALLMFRSATPREVSQLLFYGLTGMALAMGLWGGAQFTADCMTQEKRDGTLGLLFLTALRGYDVVLGKLVANSVHAVYALWAALPVMAVPLLLGSFTFGQVVQVALALLNALFFSLAAGMLASTISRTTREARGSAIGVVLGFAVGLILLSAWASKYPGASALAELLRLPSPVYTYVVAVGGVRSVSPGAFWLSLGLVHALAWLFLILACVYAPRCWLDETGGSAGRLSLRERWPRPRERAAAPAARRRRLLEINPFYWRAARDWFAPRLVWAALVLIAGVWIWGWLKYSRDWTHAVTYVATALVLIALLKLGVASEATRALGEERREGTLELLLSTPLSVREILRGQALALRRVFLWPLILVVGAEIVLMLAGLAEMNRAEGRVWIAVWVAGMFMLGADLMALYWVGMWRALAARNLKRAFGETVSLVLVLPWAGFVTFLAIGQALSPPREPGWEVMLGVWVGLGLVADVGFGAWARHKLLHEFRLRAAERYVPRVSWWRRLWGERAAGLPPV